jgi:hypothetical protein
VGWQITNERNGVHFRQPRTLAEAPAFIAAGLEGVAAAAPAALCGYNTAGTGDEAEALVRRVQSAYPRSDYIGLDTYRGTWQDGEPEDILADIRAVHSWTGLPVLLQEVGFASAGETFQMEEAFRYLRGMGFESVEALRADPEMFLRRIPYQIAQSVFQSPREEWADNALTMVPHLLKRWPGGSKVYRHTPQGQAAFYRALLGQLTDLPCICGAILYCWSDSELCYSCKCGDCPCETAWGLTDTQENPKPVYAVVKEFWGNPSEGCAKP